MFRLDTFSKSHRAVLVDLLGHGSDENADEEEGGIVDGEDDAEPVYLWGGIGTEAVHEERGNSSHAGEDESRQLENENLVSPQVSDRRYVKGILPDKPAT